MEEDDQFCRLCLSTSVVYYPLLKNNGKEMVFSLTGIQINEDDPSTESCAKCWLDLKLAYFIQQSFVEAEKKLQSTQYVETKSEDELKLEVESIEEPKEITDSDVDDIADYTAQKAEEKGNDNHNVSDDDEYHELIYIQTEEDVIEEKPSVCSICGEKCKNDTQLYAHIKTHYNGPQTCDECPACLPNISAYRDHIQTQHPTLHGKTYICGICNLSFKYKPLYDLHLDGLHFETARTGKKRKPLDESVKYEENSLKCIECNKVFLNKKLLMKHHNNVDHVKNICPICGVKIAKKNMTKHVLNHNAKQEVCDLCGKVCKHMESLKWHKYHSHTIRKKRKCEQCGKEFKKLYTYRIHLKQHAGETSFTCDQCGKGYVTQSMLNSHLKVAHLKERRHVCKYCNKGFFRLQAMKTHERNHTRELPYKCDICGESFKQDVNLRTHKRTKHHIIGMKKKNTKLQKKVRMIDDDDDDD